MPTPAQWQQAVRDAGFPLELDTDFDTESFFGFLPCKLRGEDAGFEYTSVLVDNRERGEVGAPPGADLAVILTTHSDFREFASSLLAAGALSHLSGGLIVDADSGESCPPDRALVWARTGLADIERYLK